MTPAIPPEFRAGELMPEGDLRRHLAHCGAGARIYRGCRIVGGDRVRIGACSQIDEGVFLFAGEGLEIGRNVHVAFGASVSGGGTCVIGDFAGLGAGVRIITGSEDIGGEGLTNPTVPASMRKVNRGRVEIGPHAVVFTGSIVLPDVTIGEGAVVAAGSVVHRDLKPWGIYAGNPLVQVGVRRDDLIRVLALRVAGGGL